MTYCPVDDIDAWTSAILRLLASGATTPRSGTRGATAGIARAAEFSWSRYAATSSRSIAASPVAVPDGGRA